MNFVSRCFIGNPFIANAIKSAFQPITILFAFPSLSITVVLFVFMLARGRSYRPQLEAATVAFNSINAIFQHMTDIKQKREGIRKGEKRKEGESGKTN